jgi:fermentation-respiration switch protein FrsA (DUF1100 family)
MRQRGAGWDSADVTEPRERSDARAAGRNRWLAWVRIWAPVLGLAAAVVVVVVAFEDQFIFFPSRRIERTPADYGLPYRDVTFDASDGVRLHGWWVPGRSEHVWLWLHGNAGNIGHRADNVALVHQHLGASVFIFDYRGYGRSGGQPSERGTYRDAEAALAALRDQPEAAGREVVVFGRSLGAAVAVELALRQSVDRLILEAPFTSVPAMARAHYPFLPIGPLLRTRYDSLAKIARVGVPLLILHSPDDPVVPYAQGRELFEAAVEPKRFHTIAGAGHYDAYLRGGDAYWQALADFLTTLPARAALTQD